MTATVIPFSVFAEAREKKIDPKGYAGRKVHEAIDKQVASKAAEPLLVGTVPEIDPGFDEPDAHDVPVFERGLLWGEIVTEYMSRYPITRKYLADHERQSDPGDETDDD